MKNPCAAVVKKASKLSGRFCEKNAKLGHGLLSYDMSPIVSCPGSRHATCRELWPDGQATPKPVCWGCRGRYRERQKKERLALNLRFSRSAGFAGWVIDHLRRRRAVRAVRLPGCGDIYSVEMAAKVRTVVREMRDTRFWLYTRSWCVPPIWQELEKLKEEPNVTLWLSWDRGMAEHDGPPPDPDLPWAWLATDDDDVPPQPVTLVWRYSGHLPWNQRLPEKRTLAGCLVCPHEDGVTKTTCSQCGICWREAKFRDAKIAKLLARTART